jgi:hypothetical protein
MIAKQSALDWFVNDKRVLLLHEKIMWRELIRRKILSSFILRWQLVEKKRRSEMTCFMDATYCC